MVMSKKHLTLLLLASFYVSGCSSKEASNDLGTPTAQPEVSDTSSGDKSEWISFTAGNNYDYASGFIPSQYYLTFGDPDNYNPDFHALKGSVLTYDRSADSWSLALPGGDTINVERADFSGKTSTPFADNTTLSRYERINEDGTKENILIMKEEDRKDYQHTSIGFWSYDKDNDVTFEHVISHGSLVFGEITDINKIPTEGMATYTGEAYGYHDGEHGSRPFMAKFNSNVDFSNNQFNGTISDFEGTSLANISMAGTIHDNSITGNLANTPPVEYSYDDSFVLQFHGSDADELGGTFSWAQMHMDIPDNVIRDDNYTNADQERAAEDGLVLKTRGEIMRDHTTNDARQTISGVITSKR